VNDESAFDNRNYNPSTPNFDVHDESAIDNRNSNPSTPNFDEQDESAFDDRIPNPSTPNFDVVVESFSDNRKPKSSILSDESFSVVRTFSSPLTIDESSSNDRISSQSASSTFPYLLTDKQEVDNNSFWWPDKISIIIEKIVKSPTQKLNNSPFLFELSNEAAQKNFCVFLCFEEI
jgi:hypothetical protein